MKCFLFAFIILFTNFVQASSGFYNNALTSITMNNLNYSGLGSDLVIDKAFEEEPIYKTQEVRFRSPHFKDFSIDIKALVQAEESREYFDAALNWGGISIAVETGSSETRTIQSTDDLRDSSGDIDYSNVFVSADEPLPTFCRSYSADSCINRTMIQTNQEVKMDYQSERITYTFAIKQGFYSFVGLEMSDINAPIILARDPSPVITNTTYSTGRDPAHSYESPEAWSKLLDTQASIKSRGLIWGIDGRELQLNRLAGNGKSHQHGFMGWFHIGIKQLEVSSSGQQEMYLNENFGTNYDKAEDFEELVFEFNMGLGYSGALKLDSKGRMLFGHLGVRYQTMFTDDGGTKFENEYTIDEIYGDFFMGWFAGVGITY